jgi:hypothetical protein
MEVLNVSVSIYRACHRPCNGCCALFRFDGPKYSRRLLRLRSSHRCHLRWLAHRPCTSERGVVIRRRLVKCWILFNFIYSRTFDVSSRIFLHILGTFGPCCCCYFEYTIFFSFQKHYLIQLGFQRRHRNESSCGCDDINSGVIGVVFRMTKLPTFPSIRTDKQPPAS